MKLVIPEPCNQKWNEMQPALDGRFCNACAKNVIDFTGFTDAQLAAYFKSYPKNICGKLSSGQIDRSLANLRASWVSKSAAASKPYSIRQSPLLVGLGFSLLNITSCIPAMGQVSLGEVEITETHIADSSLSSENFSKSEERKLNDLRSNDGKLENGDAEARREFRSKADRSKTQDSKPEDNVLISPNIGKQNQDLLQTGGSDYLTNHFNIVDTVITGIVKDTTGLPIAGVSVIIHGSPIGVTTNNDGRFSLKVPDEQIADSIKLSIQHVGYNVQLLSVKVPFARALNVSLVPVENTLLGDIVFTGGICVQPSKWQRVKNWVTFWK